MSGKAIPPVQLNRKRGLMAGGSYPVPRVTHRAGRGKKDPRFQITCGDCNQRFDIYYDGDLDDFKEAGLKIAGVIAGVEDWRAILLPLLGFECRGGLWVDVRERDASAVESVFDYRCSFRMDE